MFKKCFFKFSQIIFLLSFLTISAAINANLIVNGSFEDDPFTANGNYQLGLTSSDVTGWDIPNSNGTYPWGLQDGAFGAFTPYGSQFVVLGLWSSGFEYSIQQTMSGLIVGETYHLSFAIASEQGCCSQAEVSFLDGSSTSAQVFNAPSSGNFWTDWGERSMDFVATSNTVTLQFKNVNVSSTNGYDLGLDNVIVEQVSIPEPTSIALLGLGLIILSVMRKRDHS
ncbi:MAG: DUF642 domain-containing protein [Nitrosomonas sp.]|nr:DUF642 domain-containing protein [Nitrosomonas sp.]